MNNPEGINSDAPQSTEWDSLTEKSPEQIRTEERERGKKILGAINFHASHKPQVEQAFNEARNSGMKFGDGERGRDRRISAYLASFENNTEKTTLEKEKEFLDGQVEELLDNVPEYVEQNLRDQLEDWSNYLGGDETEYPTWFKLWVWDGMTRLGGYNTETGTFDKRSKETLHTYPPLDKESVEDVYHLLNEYHNSPENFDGDGLDEKDVAKYNFNALYSHFMNKHIVPTPEYGEEIHGEWTEYREGQEEEVAKAANGTGWCVVSPTKAKEYLEKGTFTFLHLENPHNFDEPDYHACASIRTEGGKVEEISGRRPGSGQMLEDALVETVEKKVLSMPGGEEYREAFKDRKELIRLCHKKEELTVPELEFVYEVNHQIPKLEKHCAIQPHLAELKAKYDIETAISMGLDKDALVETTLHGSPDESINSANTLRNLDSLLHLNVPADDILSALNAKNIVDRLDQLKDGGVPLDKMMDRMGSNFVAGNIEKLTESGVSIEDIAGRLSSYETGMHVEDLLNRGADVQAVVDKLFPEDILKNLDLLNSKGADLTAEDVISEMSPRGILRSFDTINSLDIDYDVYSGAVSEITANQLIDASARDDVFEFIKNPSVDMSKFLGSFDPSALAFVKHVAIARLKNDKEAARGSGDTEKLETASKLLEQLNGNDEDEDDDWF